MNLALLQLTLQPIFEVIGAVILSGTAVVIATQILKLDFIPVPAKKYPRITAAVVSLLASFIALFNASVNLVINTVPGYLALAVATLIVASVTYNQVVKGGGKEVPSNTLQP